MFLKITWLISFILAFSVNLIPALKHPDSNMSFINLLTSGLFIIGMLVFIRKMSSHNKYLKVYLILGFLSGIIVYSIKTFDHIMMNYAALDIITSIQYPLYLVFTTPLFGINSLLDINYETFSLLTSLVYILALICTYKRIN